MKVDLSSFKKYFTKEVFIIYIIPTTLTSLIILSFLHFARNGDNETQSITAQLNSIQTKINQLFYHSQNAEGFKNPLSSTSYNTTLLQKPVDQSAKFSDFSAHLFGLIYLSRQAKILPAAPAIGQMSAAH